MEKSSERGRGGGGRELIGNKRRGAALLFSSQLQILPYYPYCKYLLKELWSTLSPRNGRASVCKTRKHLTWQRTWIGDPRIGFFQLCDAKLLRKIRYPRTHLWWCWRCESRRFDLQTLFEIESATSATILYEPIWIDDRKMQVHFTFEIIVPLWNMRIRTMHKPAFWLVRSGPCEHSKRHAFAKQQQNGAVPFRTPVFQCLHRKQRRPDTASL